MAKGKSQLRRALALIKSEHGIRQATNQILAGVSDGSAAAAGNIGEFITSGDVTGVVLSSGTAANVTSLSLTAGDWDVSGRVGVQGVTNTSVVLLAGASSLTSATVGNDGFGVQGVTFAINSTQIYFSLPTTRYSLSSTSTVFLTVVCTFLNTAPTGLGRISARRIR